MKSLYGNKYVLSQPVFYSIVKTLWKSHELSITLATTAFRKRYRKSTITFVLGFITKISCSVEAVKRQFTALSLIFCLSFYFDF